MLSFEAYEYTSKHIELHVSRYDLKYLVCIIIVLI